MGFETELLRRCQREGTPLIEENLAVFVWHGENPPRLMGDFNGWDEGTAIELQAGGENLWFYELELPDDAYIEYIFVTENLERALDPFNPRITPNGMGKTNQFFYMPKGKPSPWILRSYRQPRGVVNPVIVEAGGFLAGGKRTVHFYQPPVDEPAPLMVVWDGGDYLRRAKLATTVDNLIAAERIRPLALAMVEGGGPARLMEYACSETTIGFILSHLLPEAYQNLNLIDLDKEPGAFGVMGASMGGLMALYTGLRLPHLFGRVLAQSGGYRLSGYEFITSFMVEHGPRAPVKIWMDVGRYEHLLEANRMMKTKLEEHGYAVDYHEINAGHNYPAWRDDLPGGLEFLFQKPVVRP
jgi:enterochelin esterase-like enzyme